MVSAHPSTISLCQQIPSIIVPIPLTPSLQQFFLKLAYEDSGHQGVEQTLSRLFDVVYWVGMVKSVMHHGKVCVKCQFFLALPLNYICTFFTLRVFLICIGI